MSRTAMLVSNKTAGSSLKVVLLMMLMSVSSFLLAADTDLPEMDLLEYLGSWEESDEEWVLLSEDIGTQVAAKDSLTDVKPAGDDSVEQDDES